MKDNTPKEREVLIEQIADIVDDLVYTRGQLATGEAVREADKIITIVEQAYKSRVADNLEEKANESMR